MCAAPVPQDRGVSIRGTEPVTIRLVVAWTWGREQHEYHTRSDRCQRPMNATGCFCRDVRHDTPARSTRRIRSTSWLSRNRQRAARVKRSPSRLTWRSRWRRLFAAPRTPQRRLMCP